METKVGHSLFAYSGHSDHGTILGNVIIDMDKVKWKESKGLTRKGEVECIVNGERYLFDITMRPIDKHMYMIELHSKYRNWYGYPAQMLLVGSVPFDVATTAVVIGGFVIVAPFVFVIGAVSSD